MNGSTGGGQHPAEELRVAQADPAARDANRLAGNMRALFLPSYSSEFNLQEHVRDELREELFSTTAQRQPGRA